MAEQRKLLLLLQRTQARFPALMWWLTAVFNYSSKEGQFTCVVHIHLSSHMHTYT